MIEDRETSLTYKRVSNIANYIGSFLSTEITDKLNPIAVFLPRGHEVILANLGTLFSGNIYLNLDTKSPFARIDAIIRKTAPGAVITNTQSKHLFDDAGYPFKIFTIEEILLNFNKLNSYPQLDDWKYIIDTDPIAVINTSGSTGVPKGVTVTQRGIIDFVEWAVERYQLDQTRVVGNQSPFFFDIYLFELVMCMATGAKLVILPEEYSPFPAKLLEYMYKKKIDFIFWVPTIMVNIANLDLFSKRALPPLKNVWFAGEVFPTKHMNYWRKNLPEAIFTNLYGPIEISLDCTFYDIDQELDDEHPIPIGQPMRNTDVLILNKDNVAALPNEYGELCVRGSSLASGYYNDPEKTAERFVQNPLHNAYPDTIYRTGDLVYRDNDNLIHFVGRQDFQIKHQGYRIELGEIETAALKVRDITNCCVQYNSDDRKILMFYEAQRDLKTAEIRTELLRYIPKYMLPATCILVSKMPMNSNGKIDRLALQNKTIRGGKETKT